MSFHQFVEAVFKAMDDNPEWRQGQTLFNVYAKYFPEKAEQLRGSRVDPFYRDENVSEAWDFIGKNWDNPVDA